MSLLPVIRVRAYLEGVVPPFFVLLLVAPTVWAQGLVSADSTSYFPIHERNVWQYVTVIDPPFEKPDTLGPYFATVSAPLAINDTLYRRVDYPFSVADTVRRDGDGSVWARTGGRDLLLFDFSVPDGATYTFSPPHEPDIEYEVRVSRRDVTSTTSRNGTAPSARSPNGWRIGSLPETR